LLHTNNANTLTVTSAGDSWTRPSQQLANHNRMNYDKIKSEKMTIQYSYFS